MNVKNNCNLNDLNTLNTLNTKHDDEGDKLVRVGPGRPKLETPDLHSTWNSEVTKYDQRREIENWKKYL